MSSASESFQRYFDTFKTHITRKIHQRCAEFILLVYDPIKQSQIDWFTDTSRAQRSARRRRREKDNDNGNNHFHLSLAFLHIPLPEFGDRRLCIRSIIVGSDSPEQASEGHDSRNFSNQEAVIEEGRTNQELLSVEQPLNCPPSPPTIEWLVIFHPEDPTMLPAPFLRSRVPFSSDSTNQSKQRPVAVPSYRGESFPTNAQSYLPLV